VFGSFARCFGAFLAVFAGACHRDNTPPPSPAPIARATVAPTRTHSPEPGTWYRARLIFDQTGELPFFLHVPPVGQKGRAYVQNGDETAEFTAEWRDNEITINGPWNYTSTIEADLQKDGTLVGQWTRDTPLWGAVVRTFKAAPIAEPDPHTRFPGDHAAAASVAGTWRFTFAEHGEGKGTFEQDPDGVVRGYIKPGQLGDIRFLAGNVHDRDVSLSTFNGNSANLVLASISADGASMSGLMSMQNVWNEKFTATRTADFPFVNKVHLKEPAKTVTLKGLDAYKGKPTIAVIFATWCSSCNDAYPFFKELYAQYHARGLEFLGVAYDLTEDDAENQKQLEIFRKRHDIPWQLLEVPCTPETWAKAMPPELVGWDGLPIILLVRPDGTVKTVFGGWFGPATGQDGQHLRDWFTEQTRELVEGTG
jgi:thiol-disulfide isomerase/thioredoxin